MPNVNASLHDDIRELVASLDKRYTVPVKSAWNKTGYAQVIQVKKKFQARLQVPGDGRGGTRKRKQYSLPCLFDTAEHAALYLAWVKEMDHPEWEHGIPPKLQPWRKPRSQPPQPATPPEPATAYAEPSMPLAMTMAVPINFPMPQAPFVAVSPLPMPQLSYMPPFRSAI